MTKILEQMKKLQEKKKKNTKSEFFISFTKLSSILCDIVWLQQKQLNSSFFLVSFLLE